MAGTRATNGAGSWRNDGKPYILKNGQRRYVYGISYKDPSGVLRSKEVRGATKKACLEAADEWRRENLPDGRMAAVMSQAKRAKLTVVELCRQYIENNPRGLKPRSVKKYTRSALNLEKEFGDIRPEGIQVGRVRKWVLSGGPSRQDELNLLRAALNWGHGEAGLIRKNPLGRGVRITPPEPDKEPVAMPEDAYARLLEASAGTPRQLMWKVGFAAGLRREELWGLNWGDIDERTSTVTVTGKGNKTRTIPFLDEDTFDDLRREREARGAGPNDPVFLSTQHKGKRVGYSTIYGWWTHDLKLAGLEGRGFTPHTLRHTFATELVNNTPFGPDGARVPLAVAGNMMGHANPRTTEKYVHVTPGAEILAASALAARKFGRRKTTGKTTGNADSTQLDPRDSAEN